MPVVVACAMSSASAIAVGPEMPSVEAARSIESRMPWLRSCLVDSALPTPTRPPGARITVSVKVPPVSTPMRYTGRKIVHEPVFNKMPKNNVTNELSPPMAPHAASAELGLACVCKNAPIPAERDEHAA